MKVVKELSRDYMMLYAEVADLGVQKLYRELGWGLSRRMFKLSERVRESYFFKNDFDSLKKGILGENPKRLTEVMEASELECAALRAFIEARPSFSELSDRELAQLLKEFVALLAATASNYWIVFKLPDYYAEERVLESTRDEGREACFKRAMEARKATDGIFEQGFVYARALLREVGARAGVEEGLLDYATSKEVIAFLEDGAPFDVLELRRRSAGMFYTGDEVIVAADLEGELKKRGYELDAGEDYSRVTEVKGAAAFQGKITGAAKIVLRLLDIDKVCEGDVLIAPMTSPDMITAMRKASAFVTDEGGVTCHAAIVAREFAKPCVVGTKIATKVFKDGDLVEVDATNGIVRKAG